MNTTEIFLIALGPGALGAAFPEYYQFVFNPQVVTALNGVAWWANRQQLN